jgi:hypothetical protein
MIIQAAAPAVHRLWLAAALAQPQVHVTPATLATNLMEDLVLLVQQTSMDVLTAPTLLFA